MEVDLSSLSTVSLDKCSFSNTPEYYALPVGNNYVGWMLRPSQIIRLGTIGTSGFISIVVSDMDGYIQIPSPDLVHNFQGICVK